MDVLCTDKTGTLTEGAVRLDAAVNAHGEPSERAMRLAYWNARLQSGLANPLDAALVLTKPPGLPDAEKIDEIPYDFARKRLSVAAHPAPGEPVALITKGAFENVLAVCKRVRAGEGEEALDPARLEALRARFAAWSGQGYRVLGLASKATEGSTSFTREDEVAMTFEGFLLFFDPPKADAREAVASLAALGVHLKMITGDNRLVAAHVAESLGMRAGNVITGADLGTMSDEALARRVEDTDLFAETDPGQKERIILALKRAGHVVGYMGDGINDAPALHDADVGISVEGAVDVAREAADFVLLERDLGVLRRGIEGGRVTFANSIKYIFTTTSANFGNMVSMACASLFLPFLPLLASQILLNNFLSDLPSIALASDNVDREWIERPRRWDLGFIRRFMVRFGLLSSAFDLLTFAVLLWVVRASPAEFRSGWFVESLMTELLVVMVVRTRGPFYGSRPGNWLIASTLAVVLLTPLLPYLPFARALGFAPLPLGTLLLLLGITLAYVAAAEIAKRLFYRAMSRRSGEPAARSWPTV
jgi:Mg2+-importing ATPase